MNAHRTFVAALALLVALVSPADAAETCSADDALARILANLRGPEGTMTVASGTLTHEGVQKTVKFAHYVSPEGVEAFQGEDLSVNDGLLRKIRLVRAERTGEPIALIFTPSMRQGRTMRFRATRPLFGTGEYHQYLLLPSKALEEDYDFRCETREDGKLVLSGTKKPDARFAPYPSVELVASPRGDKVIVEQATCAGTDEFPSFTQTFAGYEEVAPGHFAPREISLDQVHLELTWRAVPAVAWIVDTGASLMEEENIP